MKQTKLLLATIALLLCSLAASAHDFVVNGIYYDITSSTNKTVEVTYQGSYSSSYDEYKGSVVIPSRVSYGGSEYRVTSIGDEAFRYCSSLTSITIPEGVTSIGESAFEGCSNLTAITIPEGVTSIGRFAFEGCSSLTAITIPEGVTSIGEYAFRGCSSLTSITIPEGVTSIGIGAFEYCSSLTSITIPEGVTSIGIDAFDGCSNLTSITLPEGVTSIGGSAFEYCSSLTSITIPESVTSIGDSAFSGCSSLTAITIPESVTSIVNRAFYRCTSLTSITCKAVTPPTIYSITFSDVDKSIPVYVPAGSVEAYKAAAYWKEFTNINGVVASGTCGDNLTWRLTEEYELVIEGTGTMTNYSSSAYVPWYSFKTSIKGVTLSEGVTSVGDYAFYGCSSLTSITCKAKTPPSIRSWFIFEGVDKSIPVYVPALSVDDYKADLYWSQFTTIYNLTPSDEEIVSIDIASNADVMLYTNAPCTNTTYGDQFVGWHVLFDNDPNTFFHSEYSDIDSADGLDHYLRVDLGAGNEISTFAFTFTTRGNDATYTPTRIVVEGSNTANGTYTEIAVLTDLPREKGVTYQSSVLGNGMAYRYIRYRVTETVYNNKVKGHPYFYFAEFGMMKIMEGISAMGSCGDNLSWILNEDGVLFIEGTGEMYDYEQGENPWAEYSYEINKVVLSEGVTSIGEWAFGACYSLTSITIPESVMSIGSWAFKYCSNLTTITIPENVTSIESSAFRGCSSLASIVVAEGNEVYDSRNDCNAIIETSSNTLTHGCSATIIPESVTSIGSSAFDGCSSLTTITIPEGVTSIGSSAFNGCSSLTSITCNGLTPPTIGNSDTFANVDKSIPVYVPAGSVQAYKAAAYWNEFANIKGVVSSGTCGDNLTWKLTEEYELIIEGTGDMYDYSPETTPWYEYRESIQAITIPEGVTSIEGAAFYGCSSLTAITIPEGVTSIGNYAFEGCSNLTAITIPESVTSIGGLAFEGCSSLTTINIPEGVTSIGYYAFSGCSSLTSMVVAEGNTIYDSRNNCNAIIETCSNTLTHGCSATIIPESVTSIRGQAFHNCSSLTTITIPESVTSIGSSAFNGCSSLTSITCNGLTPPTIGNSDTFANVDKSIPVYVPAGSVEAYKAAAYWSEFTNYQPLSSDIASGTCGDNLTWRLTEEYELVIEGTSDMYNYSYDNPSPWNAYREMITTATLPEGVTSIGERAFYKCSSLTSITIPEGVTSIEGAAFYGCSSLERITIPEGVTSIGEYAFAWCENLTAITIPEGVTSIGDYAFEGCISLTSITLPASVTSIRDWAFYGCSNLTAITIPEGVTSIGEYAFERCSSLTTITIPEGVTSIGEYAFGYCSGLTTITCNAATPPTAYFYTFYLIDKSIPVYVPAGSVEAYRSAEYWSEFTNYQPLSSDIASGTCGDNLTWRLTEEYELFIEGTGDMYDYTQGGTPWSEYRDAILTITLPEGMTRIGHWAFSDCTSITTITVPASVTSIGYGILMGCTALTSIAVEEGNTVYDSRNGCNAIVKTSNNTLVSGCSATVIPQNVTSIGNRAFGYCTFTTIDIPEDVTSIGDYAFGYCSSLATIILPESMTAVGTGAFVGCRKLAELTSLATTPPALGSNTTFGNVNKSIPVYVPAASVEAYKSAEHWSEFTNYQTIEGPAPEAVTITISKYGSGTYSSAYALDFNEVQGLKAYVATGYNHLTGVVTLLRVHTADAATGLLVKGTPGASYEVPVMEYTADRTLNMMVATLERTEVDSHSSDGVYANYKYTVDPAQNPDEPLFYPFADGSHLSAGKAYLQIPVAWLPAKEEKARSIRLRFDEGETTDIEDEEIINQKSEIIYDLYGRRVVSPKKGEIYIVNNQKVIY